MASSPRDHHSLAAGQEDGVLLDRVDVSTTAKQCCDNLTYFCVTFLIILDLVTDIWVITVFGERKEIAFMGVLIVFLLFAGLILTITYFKQTRSEEEDNKLNTYIHIFLNFPLQLGIIYERCIHGMKKCHSCCPFKLPSHTHTQGLHGKPMNADWKFAKLKLIQSMFHCLPQLIGNLLHMLMYREVAIIQYVSAVSSFHSLILGVVLHEKSRKEQARGALMGLLKVLCIFLYKTLILGTRILAIVHFMYYFGGWISAILFPHFVMIFPYYLYLYRKIWKVQYHTVLLHSLYSMFAYFPILSDYRPEGEVVLFHILFMIENILMVALPFKTTPTQHIARIFAPTSRYYFIMMLVVLVGSTFGLIFMCIYYFFLHKSRRSIREANFGWLACICEWRKYPHDEETSQNGDNDTNHVRSPSLRDLTQSGSIDVVSSGLDTLVGHVPVNSGPSGYYILPSEQQSQNQADLEMETPCSIGLLAENSFRGSSAPNPLSGSQNERLLIQGENESDSAYRPSVLEGEDECWDPDTNDKTPIVA